MSRRGENIRKRSDGRWEGRYSVYDLEKGKNVMRSVYAKSYKDVKIKLANAKGKAEHKCTVSENNITELCRTSFNEIAYEWLENIKIRRKRSTYVKYKGIYEKYLLKYMDSMSVGNIADSSINEIFRQVSVIYYASVSSGVIKSVISIFNRIMSYASEKYGIVYKREKFDGDVKVPAVVDVFTIDEQIKLIKEIYSSMDCNNLGIYICLATGMRLGEICALRWEDIDMVRRTIKVNQTVQRISVEKGEKKTALITDVPKSIYSKREIPISDELFRLLNGIAQKQGYVLNDEKPLEPRTYEYRFNRLLVKAGICHRKFHILRHTFATNCVVNGVDIKTLSELLGHSDVKITLNRYVHPTLDIKRTCINSIADIYGQYMGQL